ncbi:unnamed protein product [Durusdinium trenchii]|uniref:Uncharacterized protein n=1 Tax=Durusdinium trenchii TaxID=1381693 RepID=A0ABP0Q4X8_9DINO
MTTPLVAAASHGHVEVVKLLLAARADPHLHWEGTRVALELQRPSLMTPWGFKWDQRFGARRVLEALLEKSPASEWNQRMMENREDFLQAGDELIVINDHDFRSGNFFAFRELLDISLCFQRVRTSSATALERAAVKGHQEVCDALLTAGVDATTRIAMRLSPVEIFAKNRQVVLELKAGEVLVLAFLVCLEESWEALRAEVQNRLGVARASFFANGCELIGGNVQALGSRT